MANAPDPAKLRIDRDGPPAGVRRAFTRSVWLAAGALAVIGGVVLYLRRGPELGVAFARTLGLGGGFLRRGRAPLARPDRVPAGLERLGPELGRLLAAHAEPTRVWEIARQRVALDHPVIIGILNVTPDSFSDGGRFATVDRAIAQAERLLADGCELLDVGGESTRPGAATVALEEEIARVVPVIEQLVRRRLGPVSVDTRKAPVARAAIAAGAAVVNDVSGLAFDPALAPVAADAGVGVILMHMRGTPDTMDSLATYRHVAAEVAAELDAAARRAEQGGVARE